MAWRSPGFNSPWVHPRRVGRKAIAPVSKAGGRNPIQVRVLYSPPYAKYNKFFNSEYIYYFYFGIDFTGFRYSFIDLGYKNQKKDEDIFKRQKG